MALYAIEAFTNRDSLKAYEVGNKIIEELSDERLKELSSTNNAIGKPVVVKVDDSLTKKELLDIARKIKLDVDEKGSKADILKVFK